MNLENIKIGKYYRHKDTPNYAWARPIAIIRPHFGVNPHDYSILECEWTLDKNATMGLIKYFKATDLIESK